MVARLDRQRSAFISDRLVATTVVPENPPSSAIELTRPTAPEETRS